MTVSASDLPPAERVLRTATPEWVCQDPSCDCRRHDAGCPKDNLGDLLRVHRGRRRDDLPPWDVSPHLFEDSAP